MKPSEISASRFLALRASKDARARAAAGVRLRLGWLRVVEARLATKAALLNVESHWRYVAAHVPDAVSAWVRDVGLDATEFVLGTTGKSATAVAIDLGCYTPGYSRCRCHSFRGGKWRPMCHPPIVNGSGEDCDACEAPCSACLVEGG